MVDLLNDLYTCFDRVLDTHDVYKVRFVHYSLFDYSRSVLFNYKPSQQLTAFVKASKTVRRKTRLFLCAGPGLCNDWKLGLRVMSIVLSPCYERTSHHRKPLI